MNTVLFSKDGDTLVLRYNLKAARGTVILISVMFVVITAALYLSSIGVKVPRDKADFIFIGLMFCLYLLTMAYYGYTIFSRQQVELIKNYEGYVVKKNNKIRTGIIRLIIKRRVIRQHDEGYSIIVSDIDNKWYTLFATLREPEALELAQTLSAAMNLPVELTEADGWL
ncbi:MAG TPA: hypothetical protein VK668_22015 [Mucilaginibacter sp.]|nr:hypothetical protein [Mucilaginibacter sp.]